LAILRKATDTGFGNFMSAAKGENKPLVGDRSDIATHKVTSTSIGTNLGKIVHVSGTEGKRISEHIGEARSLGKELSHRLSGNEKAASDVRKERIANKAARIAEERAQRATQFHEAATALIKKREAEPKVSRVEIDLSKKPFSDAVTKVDVQRIAKKAVKNHEEMKKLKVQRLVANRTNEALSPREAQVYAKEAIEEREIQQK
jgi:hypothetical protein